MDRSRLRRRPLAVLLLALLGAGAHQLALASPAAADPPAVVVDEPSVSGSSVTVAFTVNRGPKAIGSVTCALTGTGAAEEEVPCGDPSAGEVRKAAAYTVALEDVAAGDHGFSVRVVLTDGGTASGGTSFTVEDVDPGPYATTAEACGALPGGDFVTGQFWWQLWTCDFDAATQSAATAAASVLGPRCLADGGDSWAGGFVAAGRYELSCWVY